MKKFFGEFKTFITRGNVVDMAVGVIVGSSFTAIVNALSNNILKPVINWILATIFGADSLSEVYTFLKWVPAVDEAGNQVVNEAGVVMPDLTQSIYIDWGAFINAVLNFFIVAFVLFCIVRTINKLRAERKEFEARVSDSKPPRADRKAMKKAGIKWKDKAAVAAWYAAAAEAEAAAKAEAEEAARLERLANPTTEDLLKSILEELKKN